LNPYCEIIEKYWFFAINLSLFIVRLFKNTDSLLENENLNCKIIENTGHC